MGIGSFPRLAAKLPDSSRSALLIVYTSKGFDFVFAPVPADCPSLPCAFLRAASSRRASSCARLRARSISSAISLSIRAFSWLASLRFLLISFCNPLCFFCRLATKVRFSFSCASNFTFSPSRSFSKFSLAAFTCCRSAFFLRICSCFFRISSPCKRW